MKNLFRTKGINGFKFCCFIGWKYSKHNPDGYGTEEWDDYAWSSNDRGKGEVIRNRYNEKCKDNSDSSSEKGEYYWFCKKLRDDISIEGSYWPTNSYFTGSFRYRNKHDIHNSDSSYNEWYSSNTSKKYLEGVRNTRNSREHISTVSYTKIYLRFIGDFEFFHEYFRNSRFYTTHTFWVSRCNCKLWNIFISNESALSGSDWDIDSIIGIIKAISSFCLQNTYDSKIHISNFDTFSEWTHGSEEIRYGCGSENCIFNAVFYIIIRKRDSILHLHIFYTKIGRSDSIRGGTNICWTINDLFSCWDDWCNGSNVFDSGNLLGICKLKGGSLCAACRTCSNSSLPSSSCHQCQEIRSKGFYICGNTFLCPFTEGEEDDHRRNTDNNTEAWESGTEFVYTYALNRIIEVFEDSHR